MRQAALPVKMADAEMAAAAMKFLADPTARPEIRATAAWALGMVRVNPAVARYNFPLVAHVVGQLAAELGDKAGASFSENPTLSEYLSGLLVGPIFQAFNGVEGARESGLLKTPGLGQAATYVKQVADLQASVARASVELVRAPAGQVPARKKDLSDRVAALKAFLDKNPPKDFHLIPAGPEYRPAAAGPVAKAAEPAKAAGVAGGR